jgi:photosystem II stability/assembly factor-like uncharacterized protein
VSPPPPATATLPNQPDDEVRLLLERRAAFDGAAWERAIQQKAAMAARPAGFLPSNWPPPPPPRSTPPRITIVHPPPPVMVGAVTLKGTATGGYDALDQSWRAITDISVQLDGGPSIAASWPDGVDGQVPWSAIIPISIPGTHTISATVTTDVGTTARSQIVINVTPLGWSDVGPANIAGCVLQVVVDPTNSDRLYAASNNGGVWRLDSVAAYPAHAWVPITDQQPSLALGSVAVAASDGRVLYYADALQYVYRSADRGGSWTRTSATQIGQAVYKLIVHPDDADTVYAATSTGLWFTGDAGVTWSDLNAGKITDVAMDPVDSSILYIGKPGSGVLKSYNSGLVWQTVLPWSASAATWPMIKVAVGSLGTEATRMVAAKLNEEVWLNPAAGRNGVGPTGWVKKASLNDMGQWDWDHVVAVNPFDDNVVLVGGQTLWRTADGGATWSAVVHAGGGDPTHEDQQSVAFDANASGVVYLSNDGGVWRSIDGGQTWATGNAAADISARRNLNQGLVTAEFFRVGAQGNAGLGDLMHSGIIGSTDLGSRTWVGVEGHAWEFAQVYGDPRRPGQFYVVAGGLLRHHWPLTGSNDFLIPWGTPSFTPTGGAVVGSVAADPRSTSSSLVVGAQNPAGIMRGDGSLDAPTWTSMTGAGSEAIASIDFAPSFPGRAYAISLTGHLYLKDDVNDDVTSPGWTALGQWVSPTGNTVRQLRVNALDANRLYAITAREIVRWTPAGGWTSIMGSGISALPNSDLHSLIVDPQSAATLYVGADIGVFVSRDDGASWSNFSDFLPNALLGQIFWDGGWIYATTYGRGLWRRRP